MKKVVTIGGGTGQYHLLLGLKELKDIMLTAIVTMADSGGSSGRLRNSLGALPPGDILRCLLALSTLPGNVAYELLSKKIERTGKFHDHNFGNLLLTVLEQWSGSFLEAVCVLEEALLVKGHVLPVTIGDITLHGESLKGKQIHGEADFDRLGEILEADDRISRVWLEPNGLMLTDVGQALAEADYIVVAPGDLFSSIAPIPCVRGVAEALKRSRAQIVCVGNAMTKRGQTDGFKVSDFVRAIEEYLGRRVDYVVCHTGKIDQERAERYKLEGAEAVQPDVEGNWEGRQVLTASLFVEGPFARHDPERLAAVVGSIILS
ncbi:MAG: uridine diphosphate-N-acetylglucosamine-binding protein YvcK [bacterium]|nr:uridine diphosphate-N-acetylglucosamine-binding protein YvcK [bacterium]